MPRIRNENDAESRVRNSIVSYFLQFRKEFDEFGLGDGDCSLLGGVWIQLILPDVQLMYVSGTERHVILRRRWGGGAYDADLYADFFSSNAKVRAAPVGELYQELEPITAAVLTEEEFARLREVLESTGPEEYAELAPELDQLRDRARDAKRRLS